MNLKKLEWTESSPGEVREIPDTNKIARLLGVYLGPSDRIVTYPNNGDVVQLIDVILGNHDWRGIVLQ